MSKWKNTPHNKEYQHQRWLRDKEKITLRVKKYKMEHPTLTKEQKSKDYLKHREARIARVKEYRQENLEAIKANNKKYMQSPKGRLKSYKKSALERGYDFNLTPDDFNNLIKGNCHYCGKQNANGVDRKENNIGYYIDNVVSCCRTCNYMKRDLSYEDFKDHLKKIINTFLSRSQ